MFSHAALAATSILALANASSIMSLRVPHVGRSEIQWKSCNLFGKDDLNRTVEILCGSLAVPLDYTSPNTSNTLQLPLLKIPAAKNVTKKETIFTNFGGPGINGTTTMVGLGPRLQSIVGRDRDLITWHPRGTEGDLLFSCYQSNAARTAAESALVLGNASDVAQGQLWSAGTALADTCAQLANSTGSLIGTAFTARDMLSIADALHEDGLVRYWGFSYGTILGATTAAMFPDRVGAIIIDGVVNPQEYYHGFQLTSRQSADDVLMGFARGCVQTPALCPLAANHTSAIDLYNWIFSLIDASKFEPLVLPNPADKGGDLVLSYTDLKTNIYSLMYSPESWVGTSNLISAIARRDAGPVLDFLTAIASGPPEVDSEAEYGILCGDKFARSTSLASLRPYLATLRTSVLGGDIEDQASIICAQWPFAAKERYSGSFTNVTTRAPLLVISNTWDPATPLASGRNASSGFLGSALLEQRGYGHGSVAQASLCTTSRVRDFFATGALPEKGTVCKVDEVAFPTDGGASAWSEVVRGLEAGKTGTTVR